MRWQGITMGLVAYMSPELLKVAGKCIRPAVHKKEPLSRRPKTSLKLSDEQVVEIRKRYNSHNGEQLAKEFNVGPLYIQSIGAGSARCNAELLVEKQLKRRLK